MLAKKKASRRRFREFIKEKGLLGRRGTAPGEDETKKTGDSPAPRYQKKKSTLFYLRRYLDLLEGQRPRVAVILLMVIIDTALQAALPWSFKLIVDFVLVRRDLALLLAFRASFSSWGSPPSS